MAFKAALLWQPITDMFKKELKALYVEYLLRNRYLMYTGFSLPNTSRLVAF